MVLGRDTSSPEASKPTAVGQGVSGASWLSRVSRLLDTTIFLVFLLFAIALPHSVKGAQHAWKIAFVLWLVKLALERKRPFPQPLSAPLLAYVTLSGISTAFTPDPYLSWDRMKIVCLVLVGVLFAQNLKRLSQIRLLVFALLLSGLSAALITAWQYSYGIGVRVDHIVPGTLLYSAGLHHDDIITRINGRHVHSEAQFQRYVAASSLKAPLTLDFLRGSPFERVHTIITREALVLSGYGTPILRFVRGKPFRAQGTLGHYIVFAEMMMQLGCLAWAMLLSTPPKKLGMWILLGITFISVTLALVATETRAALGGLALGCFLALFFLAGKRLRIAAMAGLAVLLACSALWIHHSRNLNWTSSNDTGTQFRMMMWEDGLRLVRQHPWFGVGMETVRVHWQEWNVRGFAVFHVQSHFHSTLLQIAVERGLLTLAAWLWFVVAYIVFLVRLVFRTRSRSRFATGVVTAVLAGFVAFVTTSLVHYNLGEEQLVTILFFYFGLAVAIDHMLIVPGALDVE